jgi:hypothetical protein
VGGALNGIQVPGLSHHITKAAVKAAVHAGFQVVQGQPVNVQDIFKDVAVNSLSGVAASKIGSLYGSGNVDPVTHKVLHSVVGGLSGAVLNGSQGATSGALSAMIAETLADLVTPQAEHIRDTLFQSGCDDPLTAYNDYLTTQKNLILITTTSIMAGLGQDLNVAINAADNALSNNFIQTALVAAAELGIDEVEENRGAVIDFLKNATNYGESDIVEALDYLIAGGKIVCKAADILSGKAAMKTAVKAPSKAILKEVKTALRGAKAVRQNAIPQGSKIEYVGPGKVKFDGVEFKAVRDLGHLSEVDLRKMHFTGKNPTDTTLNRLDGHHHKQQYHRDPGAFIVEIPKNKHKITNRAQHPYGNIKGVGLTAEQRTDWNKLRVAFNKERARTELIRRGLLND